ncbi:hypothetical protein NKZ35_25390 [Sinorhizobium meliloti]|uniref:hypothetical protein n=1 Tax=Rhizobium meliloti TaxID=382 RepID=UPI003D647498
MKIAIGIISIFLGLLVLLQSCTVGIASEVLADQATSEANALGVLLGCSISSEAEGAVSISLPVLRTLAVAHFPE